MSKTTMLIGYDKLQVTVEHGTVRHETNIGGLYIRLYQTKHRKRGSFAVQYGRQFDYALSYSEACAKYGEAVMHALSCEGVLSDNEANDD